MATAKDTAKDQLGNLDLSYLNNEKAVANDIYNTSKSSLQNNFNNLLSTISANKADNSKGFSTGRSTIAENSFDKGLASNLDLSSRVAGKTGLQGLNEVGNRMEVGQANSKLGNTFYNTLDELNTTEKQGKSQYAIDDQSLSNSLKQATTGIDTRSAEANNSYNNILAQLAEQIQGRWDSNANSKAALAQNAKIAAQADARAREAADANNKALKKQALTEIVNRKDANGKAVGSDIMLTDIVNQFGVDYATAQEILNQIGVTPIKSFNFSVNDTSTDQAQSYYDILGLR